ncbi:hypothetical protein K432DRAFT_426011 [Lepidopterella palustris CBS 459.81]|uniref:mRNA capping enzyme C-terminal domain-containing protein n=1 Tax=Lepidopterella palustris CBS 459.81 TaxID=1314670 RepID=A0A8E2EA72_9PEZI|nr:hypothetical protein K432DRAFT_426011 [Lepidopterella palustris CBS 459.81]
MAAIPNQAKALKILGACLFEKVGITYAPEYFQSARESIEGALKIPVIDDIARCICLGELLVLRDRNEYRPFADLVVDETEWETLKSLDQRLDGRIIECYSDDQGRWRYNLVAISLNSSFDSRTVRYIQKAFSQAQAALKLLPSNHTDYPIVMDHLGVILSLRYAATGELYDLQKAIIEKENAEQQIGREHPGRASILLHLSNSLESRYWVMGNGMIWIKLLKKIEEAVAITPSYHRWIPVLLDAHGNILRSKYYYSGSIAYLESSIVKLREALRTSKSGDPALPQRWKNLAISLYLQSKVTERAEDLDQAINMIGKSVLYVAHGSSNATDLDKALGCAEDAQRGISTAGPHRDLILDIHGSPLLESYRNSIDPKDLDEAISRFEDSLKISPAGSPYRARTLENLADCLSGRGERDGASLDFELAIAKQEDALEATPCMAYSRSSRLDDLSQKFHAKYSNSRSIEDLQTGIAIIEAALSNPCTDNLDRATRLLHLGTYLKDTYLKLRETKDLTQTIFKLREACELNSRGNAKKINMLGNLSDTFQWRYNREGNPGDIQEAISTARKDITIISTLKNQENMASCLGNLATRLQEYFHTRHLSCLQESILNMSKVLALKVQPSPSRAVSLNRLSNLFQSVYARSGNYADLEKSLSLAKQAVDEIPSTHRRKPGLIANFSNKLRTKYEYTGDLEDLDQAISENKKAIALASDHMSPLTYTQRFIFAKLGFLPFPT